MARPVSIQKCAYFLRVAPNIYAKPHFLKFTEIFLRRRVLPSKPITDERGCRAQAFGNFCLSDIFYHFSTLQSA